MNAAHSSGRKRLGLVAAGLCVAAVVAAPAGLALAAGGGLLGTPALVAYAANACGSIGAGTVVAGLGTVRDDQLTNAHIIDNEAQSSGLGQQAALVAIMAALQESMLTNLTGGDRDSLGLFQERPSDGWGTPAQILDPIYAAGAFYAHLAAVRGWQSLPPGQAAQEVEVSAYPGASTQWEPAAARFVATFAGTADCTADDGDGLPTSGGVLPAGYSIPPGTSAAAAAAITFAIQQIGKPYLYGGTGPDAWDCSGLVQAAWAAGGVALPRVAASQALVGTPVYSENNLLAGDLVFIAGSDGTPSAPGHVGIYLRYGLDLNAPHAGTFVRVNTIADWQVVAARHLA